MSPQRCQHCPHLGIKLETMSLRAWVTYYRCSNGHVWQVSKDAHHERNDVTQPPDRTTQPLYA